MIDRMPRSCRVDGHGPSIVRIRRDWWRPWRARKSTECWVCETPLSPDDAEAADARWSPLDFLPIRRPQDPQSGSLDTPGDGDHQ